MGHLLCDLQGQDESRIERVLLGFSLILSNMEFSISHQPLIITIVTMMQQEMEFLMEYTLNIMLYLLQNRNASVIKKLSVEIQVTLLRQAILKPTLETHIRNLLEVSLRINKMSSDNQQLEVEKPDNSGS